MSLGWAVLQSQHRVFQLKGPNIGNRRWAPSLTGVSFLPLRSARGRSCYVGIFLASKLSGPGPMLASNAKPPPIATFLRNRIIWI